MQKARSQLSSSEEQDFLLQIVSIWFQILFTPFLRVLFTFPSRYLCAIGHQRVFSLTRWFWQIPTEFLFLRGTWDTNMRYRCFRLQGSHLLWRTFPSASTNMILYSLTAIQIGPSVPQLRQHNGCILTCCSV